jgi:hypothetical protein
LQLPLPSKLWLWPKEWIGAKKKPKERWRNSN